MVLDEDRLENVSRVLAGVDRLLEVLVDVLPANHRDRVAVRVEELGDRFSIEPVAFVLEIAQRRKLAP